MVFVGFSTALVFFRTHLISFSICAGRAGSKLELWLYSVENLTHPNTFFLSSPYKLCTCMTQMITHISKTRLLTDRTVSFVFIGHVHNLKVQL
jgi:hypothetical protein